MTPTASWTEVDYYRASRAARRAFDRTNQQLHLEQVAALGEVDVTRAENPRQGTAAASSSPSAPNPPVHASPLAADDSPGALAPNKPAPAACLHEGHARPGPEGGIVT